ncbi:hypothetical protein [Streptosporangium carneum]|uniref:Uncharacterized protein n=1 Tax=Streptosporangium carneum TaxID=47481 RepID=A0A9W6MF34_9ACTN|nr:hypothetical protein [Streptosporangium carneum]GLK11831.1 hypothetical protein GCM10017600_52390 [Streptosporangium carneum]
MTSSLPDTARDVPARGRTDAPHFEITRKVRVTLLIHAALALVATVVTVPIPVRFPQLRVPVWIAIAVVAAGLAVLPEVRRRLARRPMLTGGWLLVVLTTVQAFVVGDLLALLGLWLAVPALALMAGRLRTRARKALVAAHVIASGGWVGIAIVMVTMSVIALTSTDAGSVAATYRLMEIFDLTLLPWANFAATLSGVALGLTTKWGLIRYYWVAIKLVIGIGVLVLAFGFLHDALEASAEAAAQVAAGGATAHDFGLVQGAVFWGFVFGLVNLLAAMLLSLYKPGGKTRRGLRTTARPRGAADHR